MTDGGRDDLDRMLRRAADLADADPRARWQIVAGLHRRTDRAAFEAARRFAGAGGTADRVVGLDVLGQFGHAADRPFLEETLPVLIAACADDRPDVLNAAVTAIGHVGDPRALPAVLRHAGHVSGDVRFAVAGALPAVAGDPPDGRAVAALILLTADADPEIRDWATFGLGTQLDVDDEPVRDALAARLADEEEDTAGEALVGLARRGDGRTLAPLLTWLADDPGNLIVSAAAELGAPEALPLLLRLRDAGWQRHDPQPEVLDTAIQACGRGGYDAAIAGTQRGDTGREATDMTESVETRGDQRDELLAVDTNQDGAADVLAIDTDGNGKADLFQLDSDGDGAINVTMVDLDEDGVMDVKVDGDGGHPPVS